MLAGKQFQFHKNTLVIELVNDKRTVVTIPAGDILKVVSDPRNGEDRVDVLWNGRMVSMFTVDVEGHGTEIEQSISTSGAHN
jgi:hypothetical protein